MQDATYLDEELLNKAIAIAFGPNAPRTVMQLYNALHDEAEAAAEEAWYEGYDVGHADGLKNGIAKVVNHLDPTRAPNVIALSDPEEAKGITPLDTPFQRAVEREHAQADAAQHTMDALWGPMSTVDANGARVLP